MNRLASPPSQSPSAPPSALDDVLATPLQSALNSLNVQLEQELARYRWARQGQTLPQKPIFKPRQRPLNLISVAARPAGSSAAPGGRAVPPPPPPNPRLQPPASAAGSQAIPPSTWAGGAIVPQAEAAPSDYMASDYMASSEALLESLGNETSEPTPAAYGPPTSSWTQALATPLGMGALLLLLLVSGGLGYVLVNPSAVSHLAALWPFSNPADSTPTPDQETVVVDSPSDRSGPALSPNLSEQEFVRLDLSTLSTLPLSAIRSPQAASTPTTAVDSTPTTTAIAPDSDRSQGATTDATTASPPPAAPRANRPAPAAPAAPAATPAPRPAATAPAAPRQPAASRPAATPAPVVTGSYYVVTEYTGDPSLNQARQAVGDAYVRNFPVGARIQLGAFSSEADAAAHAEALQGQGISAQVYNP